MIDRCHSISQAQREGEGESHVTPREGHWRGGSTKLFSVDKKKSWWDGAEWIWFSESAWKTTPETCVYFPDTIWPLKNGGQCNSLKGNWYIHHRLLIY